MAAIVFVALGSKVAAMAPLAPYDPTGSEDLTVTDSFTFGTIRVSDAAGNGTGKAVIFTGTQGASVGMDIQVGTVKVGDAAALGAKTTTGATTIESGAILEITAATENCIAGNVEVKSGGILQVDADIPASDGPFASGAGLTVRSGAILKLGAGKKWSKNLTIS